jgi:hypothetical protein
MHRSWVLNFLHRYVKGVVFMGARAALQAVLICDFYL